MSDSEIPSQSSGFDKLVEIINSNKGGEVHANFSDEALESVFDILTAPEGIVKGGIGSIWNDLKKSKLLVDGVEGNTSGNIIFGADFSAEGHNYSAVIVGNVYEATQVDPYDPILNSDLKPITDVALEFRFELGYPDGTKAEGFAVDTEGRVVFMGSKYKVLLDEPDTLNGSYSRGHQSPMDALRKIIEVGAIQQLQAAVKEGRNDWATPILS